MLVSVIIPTYKPKNYLWECIDSLSKQTLSSELFEIILILNGCREPWESDIKRYILNKKLENVKVLYSEIGNVSNARNVGMDICTGEYITFIDDDDYVSANYLEELLSIATLDSVSCSNTFSFYDGTTDLIVNDITCEYINNSNKGMRSINQVKKFFSGPVYKLIHKSIIANHRFNIKFKNGEDSLFMFKISKNIKSVSLANSDCIYYRRLRDNSATTSRKTIGYRWLLMVNLIKEYCHIFFQTPSDYNFLFFITRLCGAIKSFVIIK